MKKLERLSSMLLDHFILSFLGYYLLILIEYLNGVIGKDLITENLWFGICLFLYINKDFFSGKSIAKRILGFQIVDSRKLTIASPDRCVIRNLLIILWPLEVIVTFLYPQRRLGDRLADTILVKSRENLKNDSLKLKNIISALSVSITFATLVTYLLDFFI